MYKINTSIEKKYDANYLDNSQINLVNNENVIFNKKSLQIELYQNYTPGGINIQLLEKYNVLKYIYKSFIQDKNITFLKSIIHFYSKDDQKNIYDFIMNIYFTKMEFLSFNNNIQQYNANSFKNLNLIEYYISIFKIFKQNLADFKKKYFIKKYYFEIKINLGKKIDARIMFSSLELLHSIFDNLNSYENEQLLTNLLCSLEPKKYYLIFKYKIELMSCTWMYYKILKIIYLTENLDYSSLNSEIRFLIFKCEILKIKLEILKDEFDRISFLEYKKKMNEFDKNIEKNNQLYYLKILFQDLNFIFLFDKNRIDTNFITEFLTLRSKYFKLNDSIDKKKKYSGFAKKFQISELISKCKNLNSIYSCFFYDNIFRNVNLRKNDIFKHIQNNIIEYLKKVKVDDLKKTNEYEIYENKKDYCL